VCKAVIVMSYEELKKAFEEKKILKFKLYSLDYIVEKLDNQVVIYAPIYNKRKHYYNDLDELLNNFTIYNEPLIYNLDRVHLLG